VFFTGTARIVAYPVFVHSFLNMVADFRYASEISSKPLAAHAVPLKLIAADFTGAFYRLLAESLRVPSINLSLMRLTYSLFWAATFDRASHLKPILPTSMTTYIPFCAFSALA
jgi:hypothetical protein